ncbi:hypothetical protein VHUM_01657 [Vanrija humicola]|uniref:RRM domain-containing protein n=1 Tax=Vanrija humicola TaxID=5417 RepID=A0A7D8V262_VANHU|nr:hypothetical protein VHUM_01657 [Vanrija humicola]
MAEAGSSKRTTVYVAGFASAVDEHQLLAAFVTFGDILEINLPTEQHDPKKHKSYAFITFSSAQDAQDAIDNYDLNELPGYRGQGKFLKCSIANPNKYGGEASGGKFDRALWESEEWLQEHGQTKGEDAALAAAANGA